MSRKTNGPKRFQTFLYEFSRSHSQARMLSSAVLWAMCFPHRLLLETGLVDEDLWTLHCVEQLHRYFECSDTGADDCILILACPTSVEFDLLLKSEEGGLSQEDRVQFNEFTKPAYRMHRPAQAFLARLYEEQTVRLRQKALGKIFVCS